MKSLFSLALGTIVLLLATTTQDSPIAKIFLASVGLALCAVALSPRASRSESKATFHLKPGKPRLGKFSVRPPRELVRTSPLNPVDLPTKNQAKQPDPEMNQTRKGASGISV